MACDLLSKWLVHYDPLHRGWTLTGIANGVGATCGFFFPRIAGGYNLRRAVGQLPDGLAVIVGAAGATAETIETFPWVTHDAGVTYTYRLVAVSGGGCEDLIDEVTTQAAFDGAGEWLGARPHAPADLQVTPLSGGRFRLGWTYTPEGEQAAPASFRVYHDAGTGSMNFSQVVGTVDYRRGRLHYAFTSESFAEGTRVGFVVRAISAAGAQEPNERVVRGLADAAAPVINPVVVITCT